MGLIDTTRRLELKPLADWSDAEASAILSIRNQEAVRANMYRSHVISQEEHQSWIERLSGDDRTEFFAVYLDGGLVGGVSLSQIDADNGRAEWAFYLDGTVQGRGLGSALEFRFLDYVLVEKGLYKLNCEVLSFNEAVIRLHKKFGFVEEGIRREHISREGKRLDTTLLGITAGEWLQKRSELLKGAFR